eukprot:NODE_11_length_54881_cov_1.430718.p4 type:complete len:674 gc:universal NODE_11_length_54881_cov_1.430718:2388-367(-)
MSINTSLEVITGWKRIKSFQNNLLVAQGKFCIAILTKDLKCLKLYNASSPIQNFCIFGSTIAYVAAEHYGVINKDLAEYNCQGGQTIAYLGDSVLIGNGTECLIIIDDKIQKSINLDELVCDIAFESECSTIAIGTARKSIYLLSLDLAIIYKVKDNESWVRSLAWQKIGAFWHLGVASNDYTFRVYKYTPIEFVKLWLESVMLEHSDWVLSVCKHPSNNGGWFTASADQSIIYWDYDNEVWENQSFGSIGMGQIQSVASLYIENELYVFGVTHIGALVKWKNHNGLFEICPGLSGHNSEVKDIQFHKSGVLFSCGKDRTTRAYAQFAFDKDFQYREVARPQVHGYTMQCLVASDVLVSAGEEKVSRIFGVPSTFVKRLENAKNLDLSQFNSILDTDAIGASLPALGLTNKAIFDTTESEQHDEKLHAKDRFQSYGTDKVFSKTLQNNLLPTESQLMQHTLWPELQKLYGHGDNIFSMDVFNNNGNIMIATACKSSNIEQAAIRIYKMTAELSDQKYSWKLFKCFQSHKLTVTRLQFSSDGKFLLSTGRDRNLFCFNLSNGDEMSAVKAHSRVIWDGCWLSKDKFATCSRDKSLKIWSIGNGSIELVSSKTFPTSVTALSFKQDSLAVGLEDGTVYLNDVVVRKHASSVQRLSFHPFENILASCSDDHTILVG